MEVHVYVRRHRRAIKRGWLEVPLANCGFDLLVDAVADGLHDFRFYDVALGIDGHHDHDVADQIARQLGAGDGRIGMDHRIGDMNFMAGNGAVNHGA